MAVKPRRVAIIGAGAAGMACASTLAEDPTFHVTLFESAEHAGGQATSIDLDPNVHGASYMNDGVQGGSPIFRHTYHFFHRYGFRATDVDLKVSFGKGKDWFWTNVFVSPVTEAHESDIRRFGWLLFLMRFAEVFLALVPIWAILKLLCFTRSFGEKMIYPLMALFLGTGNQTPHVPTSVLCRLMTDPLMRLWDYSPKTLLCNVPKMQAFPELRRFYKTWAADLETRNVKLLFGHRVVRIPTRTSNYVILHYVGPDQEERVERFDRLIFACEPAAIMTMLGKQATWRERFTLGNVPYYDDVSVTHTDIAYMRKYYHLDDDKEIKVWRKADKKSEDTPFTPMYFIHSNREDPAKVEMSFDCTRYQPQFDKASPVEKHVFQTIFLNKEERHTWTKDEISKDKIILEKVTLVFGSTLGQYAEEQVPWIGFLNGRHSCYYIGSWTLVNMHEMAIVSGIATAVALGAPYPKALSDDTSAVSLMRSYSLLHHHRWFKA